MGKRLSVVVRGIEAIWRNYKPKSALKKINVGFGSNVRGKPKPEYFGGYFRV